MPTACSSSPNGWLTPTISSRRKKQSACAKASNRCAKARHALGRGSSMSWVCELTANAKEDLDGLPKAIQRRVARVMDQMTQDPLQGNVKALKGEEWKGVFRRRI